MTDEPLRLTLNIDAGSEADEQERIDLARRFRKAILELKEVDEIRPVLMPAGPGTKAVGGLDWQALAVTLAASGGVLTTLIGGVQAWLTEHRRASVSVKIDGDELTLTGVSPIEQRHLVNEWLRRHKE